MDTIGQININFLTFSDSPKYLTVMDTSDWVYAQNSPAYLLVTLPGSKKTKNFTFIKNKINIFNSHNLGLSCLSGDCTEEHYIDLPDGIYQICLKSSFEGIENTNFYLKTDRFRLEFSKVMIRYGLEFDLNNKEFIDYMMKIKFYEEEAKSQAMLGDFVEAQKYFEEAKKMLQKYSECKNCL